MKCHILPELLWKQNNSNLMLCDSSFCRHVLMDQQNILAHVDLTFSSRFILIYINSFTQEYTVKLPSSPLTFISKLQTRFMLVKKSLLERVFIVKFSSPQWGISRGRRAVHTMHWGIIPCHLHTSCVASKAWRNTWSWTGKIWEELKNRFMISTESCGDSQRDN